eukprot:scaffold287_cov337-Pavlova_lutheri.AAC.193
MNAFVRRRVWKRLVAFIAHCFLTRQTGLRFLEVRRKFARWHSNPFARSEWIYTSLMNLVNKYIRPYICQPLLNKQALRQILASKCCDGNAGTYKKLTGGSGVAILITKLVTLMSILFGIDMGGEPEGAKARSDKSNTIRCIRSSHALQSQHYWYVLEVVYEHPFWMHLYERMLCLPLLYRPRSHAPRAQVFGVSDAPKRRGNQYRSPRTNRQGES